MLLDTLYLLPLEEQEAILDGPALRPPPGIEPNFDHPPNRNGIGQSVVPIYLTLVTLAILLQGYARVFIAKKLHLDDTY
ncbi:hypothetical protein DL767_008249 [Monosporascus sp. MG133]|nr:hypothetical protein DL767_008249 [Monosporascus sp. MG133]